jgi:hypothetical protein
VSYREPPAVLPSLRTLVIPSGTLRAMVLLDAQTTASNIDAALAAVDDLRGEEDTRARAAAAPCPEASPWSFDGPAPRWFFPPPPKNGPRYPPANVPE